MVAADHSRPDDHRICISRQTSSGRGSNNVSFCVDCVTNHQAPNRMATKPNWIERMRICSRRIAIHPPASRASRMRATVARISSRKIA